MEESTNSSQNQSKKRTRGPTVCKKMKEKTANKTVDKTIELDELGIPKSGKWKNEFTTYLGVIGRQKVDINIESWKVVNEGLKNTIWEDIKGEWNIKNDDHKKRILKRVGKLWKDFKSRLVDKLFDGEDPCEKYDYIKKEQWEKFRKSKETPEFKEIREKAQKRQKCNTHLHYLGKGGYEGKRSEWLKEDPLAHLSQSEGIDLSLISDDCTGRGFDWLRARLKKKDVQEGEEKSEGEEGIEGEEGVYYFPNDSTKEVFQKMIEWKGKIFEGSWTPQGHDDILARGLGKKEHGGHVRGVGGGLCIRDVFGSQNNRQCNRIVSADDLATITRRVREECKEEMSELHVKYNREISEMHEKYSNEVSEMHTKLRGILDHFKQMGMPLPNISGNQPSVRPKELIRSSCQSMDPNTHDVLLDIEKPTPCRLCVIISKSEKIIVARGTAFPSNLPGARMVHGEQIAANNIKVCVDDVFGEYKTTPLPVPNKEHILVGDASGSFVQWPKNLIILGQDPIIPEKIKGLNKQKKVASKGSATQTQKHEGHGNGDADQLQNLSENCKYLHDVMMLPNKSKLTSVHKDNEVFKCNLVEDPILVSRDDIAEFLRMSCLNIPILQIFMMYIHKLCKEFNIDDFGFMCPSALALVRKNPERITNYMSDVMLQSKMKRYILAPYVQDNHWVLLLICCRESDVYVFNSLSIRSKIHIKAFLNVAYQVYVVPNGNRRESIDSRMHWHENIKCPQQRGGTECGYYVMRYMYDIVSQYCKNGETNWSKGIGRMEPYTRQQIDEIRDIWADYFVNEHV